MIENEIVKGNLLTSLEKVKQEKYVWLEPLNDFARVTSYGLLYFGTDKPTLWEQCENIGTDWIAYAVKVLLVKTEESPEDNEEKDRLWVCERCLAAIESHEGKQVTLKHYIDEDADADESTCDWCGEDCFDVLYEIV